MVDFISSSGEHLGSVGGFEFHEFPSLERLAMATEQELREAGFGYRCCLSFFIICFLFKFFASST